MQLRQFFFILLFIFCSYSRAQNFEFVFQNYTVDDGLPSSQVYQIIQDKHGYIWFGTDRGVVRFDGLEFDVFTNKDGLASNVIFYLALDDKGKLYTLSKNNDLHYFEDERFVEHPMYDEVKAKIDPRQVPTALIWDEDLFINFYSFAQINGVSLQVSADSTIFYKKQFDTKTFCGVTLKRRQNGEVEASAIHTKKDSIQAGKVEVNHDGNMTNFTLDYSSNNFLIRAILIEETYYFTLFNSLYAIDENHLVKELYKFPSRVIELEKTMNDDLLIGSNEGLWIFDLNKGKANLVLSCGAVASFYEDEKGGWWVGSLYKGLFYKPRQYVTHFNPDNNQVITHFNLVPNGFIFLTDKKDIIGYQQQEKWVYQSGKHTPHTARLFEKIDDSTIVYMAGLNESIVIKTSSQNVEKIPTIAKESYSDFEPFKQGYLGINTSRFHYFDKGFNPQYEISNVEQVKFSGLDANEETVYLSSESGSFIYTDSIYPYRQEHKFYKGILRDVIVSGDSIIAFASESNGIVINYNNEHYALNTTNGLISDDIRKLRIGDHYILAISKEGLSCINKDGVFNVSSKNGLLSNDVFDADEKDDTLWVLTNEGIQQLNLDLQNISFSKWYVYDLKSDDESLIANDRVVLGAFSSELSFEVDILDYGLGKDINYAYKLGGLDQNWHYTQDREIIYPNIPPGKYTFQLKYQKENGLWTKPTRLFVLEKAAPFYVQWWFLSLISIFFILIIYWGVQRRIGHIRKKATDKYNLLDLERRALQSQMNPHFVFNCLTSIQALIVEEKYEEANKYLVKFAKLTRTALNHTTQKFVDLDEELSLVQNYVELEQMRFSKEFDFEILRDNIQEDVLVPPTVIQPFVENAILHGLIPLKERKGKLLIGLKLLDENHLFCQIEDNGVGRSGSKKSIHSGKSMGVRLIEERLELLSQAKENTVNIIDKFENGKALGTIVELKIPIQ